MLFGTESPPQHLTEYLTSRTQTGEVTGSQLLTLPLLSNNTAKHSPSTSSADVASSISRTEMTSDHTGLHFCACCCWLSVIGGDLVQVSGGMGSAR